MIGVRANKENMLSVAVPAAMPTCMEEKALVMEKALARSTRKVSEAMSKPIDRFFHPIRPLCFNV